MRRRYTTFPLAALLALTVCVSGCGKKSSPSASTAGRTETTAPAIPDAKDVPLPNEPTGVVNVYTTPSGFAVFVDGEIARDERFEVLTTPCAVTVRRGRREFIVAKEGFADTRREMIVGEDEDMILEPESAGGSDSLESILTAAYLNAPLVEPVPLLALNTPSAEQDPFLTSDGRTIWFSSDRPSGRGLYMATRRSPYDEFGAPEFVAVTRSPDEEASPSLTADGLTVCYVVPEKSRVVTISRTSTDAPFDTPTAIQFSNQDGLWPSAQILGNGLQVFWTQAEGPGKPVQTMTARRKKRDQSFSGTSSARLPGGHANLSIDGLRQYDFDGKVLRRARRASVEGPFSEFEVVSTLELPNYVAAGYRRQFVVSDDEQWLFFTDDPSRGGDLYVSRIAKESVWGKAPKGKAIPPLRVAANPADEPPDGSETSKKKVPAIDPRTLPLPYAELRTRFRSLMSERKYDEAEMLLRQAQKDERYKADQQVIGWDLLDVREAKGYWADIRNALMKMKPGAAVRIGAAKVDFLRFEEDTIFAKAKSKEVQRSILEMAPLDLAAIIEEAAGREDEPSQKRIGVFLAYDAQGSEKGAEGRMKRAGKSGQEFVNRIPAREMHLAEQEVARNSPGAGLILAEQILEQFPDSPSASKARSLTESVYKSVEWTPLGSRKWDVSADGVYTADAKASKGAALRGPQEYENFELRLEWMVSGELGQGGVFFRWNGEDVPGTANAFKLHLANDAGTAPDMFSTGALFKVESPDDNPSLPAGEWNRLVLRVRAEKVQAIINGKTVLDTTASSKEIGKRGFVCLDGSVGGIAYRKTLLIELPPQPVQPAAEKTPGPAK